MPTESVKLHAEFLEGHGPAWDGIYRDTTSFHSRTRHRTKHRAALNRCYAEGGEESLGFLGCNGVQLTLHPHQAPATPGAHAPRTNREEQLCDFGIGGLCSAMKGRSRQGASRAVGASEDKGLQVGIGIERRAVRLDLIRTTRASVLDGVRWAFRE